MTLQLKYWSTKRPISQTTKRPKHQTTNQRSLKWWHILRIKTYSTAPQSPQLTPPGVSAIRFHSLFSHLLQDKRYTNRIAKGISNAEREDFRSFESGGKLVGNFDSRGLTSSIPTLPRAEQHKLKKRQSPNEFGTVLFFTSWLPQIAYPSGCTSRLTKKRNKLLKASFHRLFPFLVTPAGFKPTTFWSVVRCSIQLS